MRLSIHMMVLNGASVVERALRPLATIADEVVVMDQGRIVEVGSHAALLAHGGAYARLWDRQSGGFVDA